LLALIAQLRNSASHPDPSGLFQHVSNELQQFEATARSKGESPDTVLAARYVHHRLKEAFPTLPPETDDSPRMHEFILTLPAETFAVLETVGISRAKAIGLFGKLFADKGYISTALFKTLLEQGLQLITSIRKNMKNRLLPMIDKLLLRKRAIIETINDQLKNISQIEHTRHRSVVNFMVNLICALIAYSHQPHKPSLNLGKNQPILLNELI